MYKIVNHRPTTFSSRRRVYILDAKKNLFYFHPNDQKQITFNLPQGTFYSENKIERSQIFLPYQLISLTKKIISSEIPRNFIVTVGKNDNKASIKLRTNEIDLDRKIHGHIFRPVNVFVCGHEVGHHIFNSDPSTDEQNCDRFSYNCGMLTGYNPSQFIVAKEIVFKNNPDRANCMEDAVKNLNNRR